MPWDQLRAMRAIETCRTPALGGQRWQCPGAPGRTGRCIRAATGMPACGGDDARNGCAGRSPPPAGAPTCARYRAQGAAPPSVRIRAKASRSCSRPRLRRCWTSAPTPMARHPAGPDGPAYPRPRAGLSPPRPLRRHRRGLAPDGTWRESHANFSCRCGRFRRLARASATDCAGACQRRSPPSAQTWTRDWVVHSQPVGDGRNAPCATSRATSTVALADPPSASTTATPSRSATATPKRKGSPHGAARDGVHPPLPPAILPSGFNKSATTACTIPRAAAPSPLVRAMLCLLRGEPAEAPDPRNPCPPPRCPHCDLPMERREPAWTLPDIVTLSPTYARGLPAAS